MLKVYLENCDENYLKPVLKMPGALIDIYSYFMCQNYDFSSKTFRVFVNAIIDEMAFLKLHLNDIYLYLLEEKEYIAIYNIFNSFRVYNAILLKQVFF